MRVLVRLFAGYRLTLLLVAWLLLHGVVLSPFSAGSTVAADRVHHVRKMEIQRYPLLQHNELSMTENLKISSNQDEQSTTATIYENAVEKSGKKMDESDAGIQAVVEVDQDELKGRNKFTRLSERTESEQPGDPELQPGDSKEDNGELKKTEKQSGDLEQRDSVVKTDEQLYLRNYNTSNEVNPRRVAEEVKIEAEKHDQDEELKLEGRETASEEEEQVSTAPSKDPVQQHGEGEEQISKEARQTAPTAHVESIRENQQQRVEEIKEEVISKPELELKEPSSDSRSGETSTEHKSEPEPNVTDEDRTVDKMRLDSGEQSESENEGEKPPGEGEAKFVFPEPYLLGPTIKDWDKQRGNWLNSNPHMKTPDGKPRVLIVTGSQPNPCRAAGGDHFHVKAFKNKIDYARMHNYEIYYNFAWLDPLFGTYWVKLPILRKLMLTHPEIEWFFWIDSDAIFTDMLFEAPFQSYDSAGMDMIMWGYHKGFYVDKSWVAFNAGVFLLRNCQWSLDLIDKWSPMGPAGPVRVEYGKILTSFLSSRDEDYDADDQSALAYVILTDEAVKSKVKLVDLNEYYISAWWMEVVDSYERSMEEYHPGLGDWRWPWITHFTGCGPCGQDGVSPEYLKCMKNIQRALNFGDNQVLAYMGFQHESLETLEGALIRTMNDTIRPLDLLRVNPWADRMSQVAAAAAAA